MMIFDATSQLQSAVIIHAAEPEFGPLFGGQTQCRNTFFNGYTVWYTCQFSCIQLLISLLILYDLVASQVRSLVAIPYVFVFQIRIFRQLVFLYVFEISLLKTFCFMWFKVPVRVLVSGTESGCGCGEHGSRQSRPEHSSSRRIPHPNNPKHHP
jgi:hypothetical protein